MANTVVNFVFANTRDTVRGKLRMNDDDIQLPKASEFIPDMSASDTNNEMRNLKGVELGRKSQEHVECCIAASTHKS